MYGYSGWTVGFHKNWVFLDSDDEIYWLVKDTAPRRPLRLKSRAWRKILKAEDRKEEENVELTDVKNSAFQIFSSVKLSSRRKYFK